MVNETKDPKEAQRKREAAQRKREINAALGRLRNDVTTLSSVLSDTGATREEIERAADAVGNAYESLREKIDTPVEPS